MKIKLDEGAIMPTRANKDAAGIDLYAPDDIVIIPWRDIVVDTGVHVQLPPGTVGLIVSDNALSEGQDITSAGLIDCGYTGSIRVRLYNNGDAWRRIKDGGKIGQLLVVPYMPVSLFEVDELDSSDRGDDGFGSTGR